MFLFYYYNYNSSSFDAFTTKPFEIHYATFTPIANTIATTKTKYQPNKRQIYGI